MQNKIRCNSGFDGCLVLTFAASRILTRTGNDAHLMASSTRLPASCQLSLALLRMTRCTIGSPELSGWEKAAVAALVLSAGVVMLLQVYVGSVQTQPHEICTLRLRPVLWRCQCMGLKSESVLATSCSVKTAGIRQPRR